VFEMLNVFFELVMIHYFPRRFWSDRIQA
jgi:hypothetical protein